MYSQKTDELLRRTAQAIADGRSLVKEIHLSLRQQYVLLAQVERTDWQLKDILDHLRAQFPVVSRPAHAVGSQ